MAREKGMGNLQREKNGRFTARMCIDGVRTSRSTRTRNREKAEAFLQRMLAPYGRGERRLPLSEVWRQYERSPARRELAPTTLNAKKIVWMHFANWIEDNHCEITSLTQLSRDIIAEYLHVIRVGHAAGTYNNRVCTLREIFHTLIAPPARPSDDPWFGIRLLADDSHARREFSRDELTRILASAARAGAMWHFLFSLGIHTGLRLGDCCTLEWTNINFAKNIIQLIPRKTRRHAHGVPVTIPLHPDLAKLFREIADNRENRENDDARYVQPALANLYLSREHWRINHTLTKIFRDAKIATSVKIDGRRLAAPDATFHSLRHTFVSFSLNAGVPLPVVQSIVGHSTTAMTRHYYHESEDALRRAVASVPSFAKKENRENSASEKFAKTENREKFAMKNSRKNSRSLVARFRDLEELKFANLISREEYDLVRERILANL